MENVENVEVIDNKEVEAEKKEEVKEVVVKNTTVSVTESGTKKTGVYTHNFKKLYEYEDKKYTTLVFDFECLKGKDMIAIENEMAAVGEYALSPEISTSFLSKMAAKAAKVGSDVIENAPLSDFGKIKNEARNFLISTGF